jgi:hypothetical protein
MKTKKEITKTFTVAVVKDEKKKGKTKSFIVRCNVKGMMRLIERSMDTETQRYMLTEYAKYYLLDALGVKVYPLEK